MMRCLARGDSVPLGVEWRRLFGAVFLLGMLSLLWHVGRATIVHEMACGSVGCPGRERLLIAALRRAGAPGSHHSAFDVPRMHVLTHSLPEPWVSWPQFTPPPEGGRSRDTVQRGTCYADARLRVRGCLKSGQYRRRDGPGDMDGDGRWEIAVAFHANVGRTVPPMQMSRWAIVRLDGAHNELLAVVLVDEAAAGPKKQAPGVTSVWPVWCDSDDDGAMECQFNFGVVPISLGPGLVVQPPQTLARLDWTGPGGVLVPAVLPDDDSIQVWTPPDGRPLRFPAEAEIQPLLDTVLPIPLRFRYPIPDTLPIAHRPDSGGSHVSVRPG